MIQTRLAELLNVDQGSVSEMEKRTDMYLSTLRSYVEAMGGTLEARAVFPDGEMKIDMLISGAVPDVQSGDHLTVTNVLRVSGAASSKTLRVRTILNRS